MDFGSQLKKLRTNKRMTQEELGKIINVTKVSVSGYENNTRSPDKETLIKLADFFDVSVDYLLGRTSKKTELTTTHWTDTQFQIAETIDDHLTNEDLYSILQYITFIKDKKNEK